MLHIAAIVTMSQQGTNIEMTSLMLIDDIRCKRIKDALLQCGIQASKDLAKTDEEKKARVHGIPKLDDANKAGGLEESKCTVRIRVHLLAYPWQYQACRLSDVITMEFSLSEVNC